MSKSYHRLALSWLTWTIAVVAFTAGSAHAQQSNNIGLHAMPAPGAVTIDGKLEDWDLSGQIECFANYRTRNTYSAKVAAMYDKDYFYLAILWRDPTPLQNMVDANFEIGSGWKSDCVQLRMKTDLPMSLDCWYSTAAKKSVLNIQYGSFNDKSPVSQKKLAGFAAPNACDVGAKEGFTVGEDGKSYIQEIAIPWKLITGGNVHFKEGGKTVSERTSYSAGEKFQMGMEFLWGGPDGRTFPIHRYADVVRGTNVSREFFWTAENDWGDVILEPKGHLNLPAPDYSILAGAYLQRSEGPVALTYTMPYDGFATLVIEDEQGHRVRNLIGMAQRAKGPQTDYWNCTNDQGRLVPPGNYRFRGLMHQGIDPVYEATYGTPGVPPWDTGDGTGAWLSDHTPPRTVAAGKDMIVFGAERGESGYSLIGVDLNGRKKWGDRTLAGVNSVAVDDQYAYIYLSAWDIPPALARLELKTGKYAPYATTNGAQLKVTVVRPPVERKEGQTDAEYEKSKANAPYVPNIAVGTERIAVPLDGKILRFYDKKTAAAVEEMPVKGLGCVAADATGAFYVWTDRTIAKLVDGKLQPVVTADLPEWAEGMAVDTAGQVFITDGKTQQVKVYGKDGKFVRDIGIAGGRPRQGPWQPNGLLKPHGITVDAQARLWVAEEDSSPKRVSVWSAEGKLLTDYIGPTGYGGTGANADPADKTRVFGSGCEFRMDYTTNKATVVSALGAVSGDLMTAQGRKYIMSPGGRLFLMNGDSLKLVAAMGAPALKDLGGWKDIPLQPAPAGTHYYASLSFIWSDLNDDGKPEAEEVTTGSRWGGWKDLQDPVGTTGYFGGFWLDEDFNLYGMARESYGAYGGREEMLTKVPLKGWTPGGAPIWDAAKQQVISDKGKIGGCLYLPSHGMVVAGSPITGVRDDGTIMWTYRDNWYGVHASHNTPIPDRDDQLIGTLGCIGRAQTALGTVFAMNSNMGRMYLMTTDGLFVASVFQDCRLGSDPWPNTAQRGVPLGGVTMGSEWFGGHFFKSEKTNEYYLIAGFTAYNLIKLNGLDKLEAISGGQLNVTVDNLAAATAIAHKIAAKAVPQGPLVIAKAAVAPALDGKLTGFAKDSFVEWSSGPYKIRAALASDASNLYLAYDVSGDDNPMVNGGKDVKQLFVTGDSVNLHLGVDPSAKGDPAKGDAAPGDIRLLMSVFDNKPVAVLYHFNVAQGKDPVTFTCPWRSYTVDKVDVLTDAKINITRRNGGYIVEAAVPLSTLGFAPQADKQYRTDLGVIFSDAKGDNRAARVYWANKSTGLVADVPGEIMPEPSLWGKAKMAP